MRASQCSVTQIHMQKIHIRWLGPVLVASLAAIMVLILICGEAKRRIVGPSDSESRAISGSGVGYADESSGVSTSLSSRYDALEIRTQKLSVKRDVRIQPDRPTIGAQPSPSRSSATGVESRLSHSMIPESIRPILNLDSAATPAERYAAVAALSSKLTPEEIEALYEFLIIPPMPDEEELSLQRALKNAVLNTLRYQESPPPGFTDFSIRLYRDKRQDIVMRDYVLQHLSFWHQRVDRADQQKIERVTWAALQECDSSIAGTALLALQRLSRIAPETLAFRDSLDRARIARAALQLAVSDQTGELSRITALQVCANMGVSEVLPSTLRLAQTADSIPLRVSAIAALGALGGTEARLLLEQLARDADPPVRPAAESALLLLSNRGGI
jgi:hypothetical protein